MSDLRALLRQHTRLAVPPGVPELKLRVADAPVPLWEALEAFSGRREEPPFWGHAWPGGLALARYLLDHPQLVSGKTVLDFGSGGGVAALAAARAGAHVTACELDPWAIAAIEENAALNGLQLDARHEELLGAPITWDVLLVGDVFYEGPLSAQLTRWLDASDCLVLIGDPGRQFMPVAHLEPLETYAFTPNPAWDSVLDRPARVWRWKRAQRGET